MTMYQDLPSVLNLINCESPFPCNQASWGPLGKRKISYAKPIYCTVPHQY